MKRKQVLPLGLSCILGFTSVTTNVNAMVRSFGNENLSDDSVSDDISSSEDVLSNNTGVSEPSLNEEVSDEDASKQDVSDESISNEEVPDEDVPSQNASDDEEQSNSELNAGIPSQNASDAVINDKLLANSNNVINNNTVFKFDASTGPILGFKENVPDEQKRRLVIPEIIASIPVTTIGENAFRENSIIEEVIAPAEIEIKPYAFYKNDRLTQVAIYNAKTIGQGAFE